MIQRRQLLTIVTAILVGSIAVAVLDFLGPWYSPVGLFIFIGIFSEVRNLKLFLVTLAWPLYAAVFTGLWVGWSNPDHWRGIARMFFMPSDILIWLVPGFLFFVLSVLSFQFGRTLAWRRLRAR